VIMTAQSWRKTEKYASSPRPYYIVRYYFYSKLVFDGRG
jgi:hypothetical protein